MDADLDAVLTEIRPALGLHRGGVDLVEVDRERGRVVLRFTGMCAACSLQAITLREGIERLMCARLPWIKEVVTEGVQK